LEVITVFHELIAKVAQIARNAGNSITGSPPEL